MFTQVFGYCEASFLLSPTLEIWKDNILQGIWCQYFTRGLGQGWEYLIQLRE